MAVRIAAAFPVLLAALAGTAVAAGGALAQAASVPPGLVARLATPLKTPTNLTVAGLAWSCRNDVCVAGSPNATPTVAACIGLATNVGRVVSMAVGARALSRNDLVACEKGMDVAKAAPSSPQPLSAPFNGVPGTSGPQNATPPNGVPGNAPPPNAVPLGSAAQNAPPFIPPPFGAPPPAGVKTFAFGARLATPLPIARAVAAGGLAWTCQGNECVARSTDPTLTTTQCAALAASVGRIADFYNDVARLDPLKLGDCLRLANLAPVPAPTGPLVAPPGAFAALPPGGVPLPRLRPLPAAPSLGAGTRSDTGSAANGPAAAPDSQAAAAAPAYIPDPYPGFVPRVPGPALPSEALPLPSTGPGIGTAALILEAGPAVPPPRIAFVPWTGTTATLLLQAGPPAATASAPFAPVTQTTAALVLQAAAPPGSPPAAGTGAAPVTTAGLALIAGPAPASAAGAPFAPVTVNAGWLILDAGGAVATASAPFTPVIIPTSGLVLQASSSGGTR